MHLLAAALFFLSETVRDEKRSIGSVPMAGTFWIDLP
jgi:hypothetical protein